jgi:hypothetical protein
MTLYSFVLFVHVTSVLALGACLTLEVLSLFHLRRASTSNEIQLWIEPVPGLSAIALLSILAILFSGIYLAIQMSGFGLAWIYVTMGAFLLMGPLGAVTGKRLRVIRHLSATGQMTQPELLDLLRRRFLRISLGIRIAVFLGIVLLMTAKPDLLASLGIAGVSVVLGLVAAFLIPSSGSGRWTAESGAGS